MNQIFNTVNDMYFLFLLLKTDTQMRLFSFAERCNFIAMSSYCDDMLSVCVL